MVRLARASVANGRLEEQQQQNYVSQPLYLYTLEGRLVWNPHPSSPPLYLEPLESSDIVATVSYISQPTVYQTSYQSYQ